MNIVSPPACRILETGQAHSGHWNMACDEWMLETAVADQRPLVRVYAWSSPTVSLGYFQKPGSLATSPGLAGLDVVTRLSGGGAIVHHHEWTYSCVVPPLLTRHQSPITLYRTVHLAIINLIEDAFGSPINGLSLREEHNETSEQVLCFARGSAEDAVLGQHKILGSAQRRRRGVTLQHGSLLLNQSPYAPEFPGITDCLPDFSWPPGFPIRLAHTIASALDCVPVNGPLTEAECDEIDRFAQSRCSHSSEDDQASRGELGRTYRS
tara:strand:- start:424 stop:1221 length:798 start_codon:yes stop_codon:yes gene_type:complete